MCCLRCVSLQVSQPRTSSKLDPKSAKKLPRHFEITEKKSVQLHADADFVSAPIGFRVHVASDAVRSESRHHLSEFSRQQNVHRDYIGAIGIYWDILRLHCVSLCHWSFTLINSTNSYEFRSASRFLWKKDSKTSPDGSFQDLRRKFGRAKLERGQKGGHFLTVAGQTYNLRRSCRTLEIWSDGRTDLVHTEAEDGMTHDSWTHDDS